MPEDNRRILQSESDVSYHEENKEDVIKIQKVLAINNPSLIYRGVRQRDNQSVFLKEYFAFQDSVEYNLSRETFGVNLLLPGHSHDNPLRDVISDRYEKCIDYDKSHINKTLHRIMPEGDYRNPNLLSKMYYIEVDKDEITLGEWMEQQNSVTKGNLKILINCLISVMKHLENFHENHMLHLDLKPDNIVIKEGTGEYLYINDYGMCYQCEDEFLLKENVGYSAPELYGCMEIKGEVGDANYSTDVYSIAGILYHYLTNQLFSSNRHRSLVEDIRNACKKTGLAIREDEPNHLIHILQGMLAPMTFMRSFTEDEAILHLEELLHHIQ